MVRCIANSGPGSTASYTSSRVIDSSSRARDQPAPTPRRDSETLKALVSSLSLQRMGHPEEIAAAIAFLAGPAASYVTGAVLDAHGGYNA
ncbi:hypothetical protein GCM10010431_53940 [Streptomyces kunmingensis]